MEAEKQNRKTEGEFGKENSKKILRQIQEACTERRVKMLKDVQETNFKNVYGPFSRLKEQEDSKSKKETKIKWHTHCTLKDEDIGFPVIGCLMRECKDWAQPKSPFDTRFCIHEKHIEEL